ncbi:MAG TPA: HEAT repeat domain-containing protein [Anaerohalosphaeraceae bacterium]|nr:HEAT repeat domain-containing protein [Anaerohalosphaeraceae bacterium]
MVRKKETMFKRPFLLVWTITASLFGLFYECKAAAEKGILPEQVERLVHAAWKEPFQSIDATLYIHIQQALESEESIRLRHESGLQKSYGSQENLSDERRESRERNLRRNIERDLQEQAAGRRVKQRVRLSGVNRRIDQIILYPEMVFFQGTSYEEKQPATSAGPDTPYEITIVTTEKGVCLFAHDNHCVWIFARRQRPETHDLQKFYTPANLLQGILGSISAGSGTIEAKPDPDKLRRLEETGCVGDGICVKLLPDPNEPAGRTQIQVYNPDGLFLLLIVDREDYSKVYTQKMWFPKTGLLFLHNQFSEYDKQGFPHFIVLTEYKIDGTLNKKKTYHIENIILNPEIPPEVFDCNPPADYRVYDVRDPSKFREESMNRAAEYERKSQIIFSEDSREDDLRSLLSDSDWEIRIAAFRMLIERLRNNPEKIREAAEQMKKDPRPEIQKMATEILMKIEKD